MKLAQIVTGVSGVIAALAWQPAALAASLDIATFGSFQNISAGSRAVYSVQNNYPVTDALLLWGAEDVGYTSRLGFDGLGNAYQPSFVGVEIGTAFQIGEVSWVNGTSGKRKTNVRSLDLLLTVQLTEDLLGDFVFGIDIRNTRDGDKHGRPDSLSLSYDLDSIPFTVAGQNYSLNFLGLSTDQGASINDSLRLAEGNKLKVGLYGMITQLPQPVPVPAAFWLFGSGLMTLIGLARRR